MWACGDRFEPDHCPLDLNTVWKSALSILQISDCAPTYFPFIFAFLKIDCANNVSFLLFFDVPQLHWC